MVAQTSRALGVYEHAPEAYAAMRALSQSVSACGLDPQLLALVRLRASQLNGCSFCIDLHWQEGRELGMDERKLAAVVGWRGTRFFDERERAVLALTEVLTVMGDHDAVAEQRERALGVLSEREVSQVLFAIAVINAWNRLSVGSGNVVG